jgi:DNA polymerase-3 subunit epsilon
MTTWHDGRLTAFDLETTATDPEEARIVSFAISIVGGGLHSEHLSAIVDPGVEIPEEAAAIHGITTERARVEGHPPKTALHAIRGALRATVVDASNPLVIFNARYDLTVLDREFRRHDVEPLDTDRIRVVDPFVIDKWLDRFRRGSRRLSDMAAHYGVELSAEDAHGAEADALAAARLAYRMIRRSDSVQGRMPELVARRALWKDARDDLDRLHALQESWAREQAIGLRAHFTRQGQPDKAASVSEDWPIIPFEGKATA